jgi:LacI family transcriptional regulator
MEIMTNYVIGKGYKNLGFIGIQENKKFTKDRYLGFEKVMNANNRKINQKAVIFTDNNAESGYSTAIKILKEAPEIDCIICSSDDQAAGAIQAANDLGRSVPTSLGVTGFDGLGKELITKPNLTTIHQPIYEVGVELAKLLIKKIKHPRSVDFGINYYKPELRVGNSTRK